LARCSRLPARGPAQPGTASPQPLNGGTQASSPSSRFPHALCSIEEGKGESRVMRLAWERFSLSPLPPCAPRHCASYTSVLPRPIMRALPPSRTTQYRQGPRPQPPLTPLYDARPAAARNWERHGTFVIVPHPKTPPQHPLIFSTRPRCRAHCSPAIAELSYKSRASPLP
jgi:hypothetical protein